MLANGHLAAQLDELKILALSKGMAAGHPVFGTLHAARCELQKPEPSMAYVRNILKRLLPC